MNNSELIALVDRLRREPTETEWLEFKAKRYEPQVIGEYFSALANSACLAGKTRGYLVFGIDDASHDVVGTQFDPYAAKGKGNQDLLIWLIVGLQPNVGFETYIVDHPHGRVVLFEIGAAWDRLQVDRVLQRIRNLTLRTLPSGTLFPQEITQYDPWVIREALHNCIAHQDYGLRGRINVVETPSSILLSNVGSFLPGDVEKVIHQDAPLEIYRHPFLADAMVNLNMIDTQGGGIKRMFQAQIKRFFPLPDYDLSEPDRVAVTVRGEILDEQYSRLLMERADLDLWQVMLLDKIQKRMTVTREEHRQLKAVGLVEGRYPNLLIAGRVAKLTGQEARHIRERGFNKQYYLDLIIALVREHGPVSREKIDHLLLDKLPEVLTEKQKKDKVHNLLSELSRKTHIRNVGSRGRPRWQVTDGHADRTKEEHE